MHRTTGQTPDHRADTRPPDRQTEQAHHPAGDGHHTPETATGRTGTVTTGPAARTEPRRESVLSP
ncbi:hypothetical protein GTZ89_02000 [Streptomyces sp. SID8382]|uniref:hypothetical protein n=1 Tax=Streptomyces malaysiensis TaxID=92644 RepID=UPI000C2C2C3B|nr:MULTISPECIES: hypothetical protein [unclassified Streptomyces]AUA11989.1 hypothetical protein CFP59_04109 [Streptomyces sp. M56]MYX54532.1 hypothetical protein [Streptomyces sp. SID8382]